MLVVAVLGTAINKNACDFEYSITLAIEFNQIEHEDSFAKPARASSPATRPMPGSANIVRQLSVHAAQQIDAGASQNRAAQKHVDQVVPGRPLIVQ